MAKQGPKADKVGLREIMEALGLQTQEPFDAAVKQAKKQHIAVLKKVKKIAPPLWVRKARETVGKGTKEHTHAESEWDVYTIGAVMRGHFRTVFAKELRLDDGVANSHQVCCRCRFCR